MSHKKDDYIVALQKTQHDKRNRVIVRQAGNGAVLQAEVDLGASAQTFGNISAIFALCDEGGAVASLPGEEQSGVLAVVVYDGEGLGLLNISVPSDFRAVASTSPPERFCGSSAQKRAGEKAPRLLKCEFGRLLTLKGTSLLPDASGSSSNTRRVKDVAEFGGCKAFCTRGNGDGGPVTLTVAGAFLGEVEEIEKNEDAENYEEEAEEQASIALTRPGDTNYSYDDTMDPSVKSKVELLVFEAVSAAANFCVGVSSRLFVGC
jgi:hypothetical protein